MSDFQLQRTPLGRISCTLADGSEFNPVTPVRAFPLAAPDQGIALMSSDGHEVVWIEQLSTLNDETRTLLLAELATREFMPEITRIDAVSSFATPSTWTVQTSRGKTQFVLKGEEDIRRLPESGLLVADNHGILYRIRDRRSLDKHSRKLLERFL